MGGPVPEAMLSTPLPCGLSLTQKLTGHTQGLCHPQVCGTPALPLLSSSASVGTPCPFL